MLFHFRHYFSNIFPLSQNWHHVLFVKMIFLINLEILGPNFVIIQPLGPSSSPSPLRKCMKLGLLGPLLGGVSIFFKLLCYFYGNHILLFQVMNSSVQTPMRFKNYKIKNLVGYLQDQTKQARVNSIEKIDKQRKLKHSFSLQNEKYSYKSRPSYSSYTKQGQLINKSVQSVPYKFIPRYKNDTFIMPDRVFEKGKSGKRFNIKMKDSSVYSFREPQEKDISQHLNKNEKQQTIISRKAEEFNRIVNNADGRVRAENSRWFLKTAKRFNPIKKESQMFSQVSPMLEPKDEERIAVKKVCLAKTVDFKKQWRPISRQAQTWNTQASFQKARSEFGKYTSVMN